MDLDTDFHPTCGICEKKCGWRDEPAAWNVGVYWLCELHYQRYYLDDTPLVNNKVSTETLNVETVYLPGNN